MASDVKAIREALNRTRFCGQGSDLIRPDPGFVGNLLSREFGGAKASLSPDNESSPLGAMAATVSACPQLSTTTWPRPRSRSLRLNPAATRSVAGATRLLLGLIATEATRWFMRSSRSCARTHWRGLVGLRYVAGPLGISADFPWLTHQKAASSIYWYGDLDGAVSKRR